MSCPLRHHPARAFSLVELLLVMAIVAVLAALLLPTLDQARRRSKGAQCVTNLKQIGLALHSFAHDHEDKFPWQVSTNAGGTLEFVRAGQRLGSNFYFAFRHFQPLSNELVTPKLLICPMDTRLPATNFAELKNENLSYFAGVGAEYGRPDSLLAGDRNLASSSPGQSSVLRPGASDALQWTGELHGQRGNILFADGHVEQLNNAGLQAALGRTPATTLWPPVPAPPTLAAAGSGTGSGSSAGSGSATTAGTSSSGKAGSPSAATAGGSSSTGKGGGSSGQTGGTGGASGASASSGGGTTSGGSGAASGSTAAAGSGASASGASTAQGAGAPREVARVGTKILTPTQVEPIAAPVVTTRPGVTSYATSNGAPSAPTGTRQGVATSSRPKASQRTTLPITAQSEQTNVATKTVPNESASPAASAASAVEPPFAAPDNWIAFLADFIVRPAAKATWLLLLIILAVFITIEIVRRRRTRGQAPPDEDS